MFTRSYHINNSTLNIVFGNIIDTEAEIVVSSDDSYITMGGGVSAAILSVGGKQIQIDAQRKRPLSLGDVAVSTAGKWGKKFIFHAITIDFDLAISGTAKTKDEYFEILSKNLGITPDEICKYIISKSVKRSLEIANALNVYSIAFPTIGAGHAKLPLDKVSNCMIEELTSFLLKTNKAFNIDLYIYDNRNEENIIKDYLEVFEHAAVLATKKLELSYIIQTQSEETLETVSFEEQLPENPNTSEHTIFISYSRKDIEKAHYICELLDSQNLKYWIDLNGKYSGKDYRKVIIDAINKSELIIFISSQNSNASDNVYKELRDAIDKKKIIFPVKIDTSAYSELINFDLRDVDYMCLNHPEFKEKFIDNIKIRLIK